jgi:hypothetical protein
MPCSAATPLIGMKQWASQLAEILIDMAAIHLMPNWIALL